MLYNLAKILSRLFFKSYSRLRIEGSHHLPHKQGFILAPNHFSTLDAIILTAAIKRKTFTVGKKELLKNPLFKFLFTRLLVIPVNRSGFCAQGFKVALDVLRKRKVVAVFPEGYVSRNGALGSFKRGAAKLALNAKVPLIPVAIIGSNRVLPLGNKFPRPHKLIVRIGEPIYINNFKNDDERQVVNLLTDKVRNSVLSLLAN